MKSIILATDFPGPSENMLKRSNLIARHFDAKLTLMHAIDGDLPHIRLRAEREKAELLLEEITNRIHMLDRLRCEICVVAASPISGIKKVVEEREAELLIIGPHRKHFLKDVFISTMAQKTVRSVRCPVLLVNTCPEGAYKRLFLTTDLSKHSQAALRELPEIGDTKVGKKILFYSYDAPALRLTLAHTMSGSEKIRYRLAEETRAKHALKAFAAEADLGDIKLSVGLSDVGAAPGILRAAQNEFADLIVVAAKGRDDGSKILLGSVTEHVLRTSPVDVLALPSAQRTHRTYCDSDHDRMSRGDGSSDP